MPEISKKTTAIFEFIEYILIVFFEEDVEYIPNIEQLKTSIYPYVKELVNSVEYSMTLDLIECKDGENFAYLDDIKDVECEVLREQLDREESRKIELQVQHVISKQIAKTLVSCNDPHCECEDNTEFVTESIPFIKHILICPGGGCLICDKE